MRQVLPEEPAGAFVFELMRIRTIKPEFFTHDGLFEAEKETKLPLRLAYIGLWCVADREGRFKWEPRRIGAQIFPYENIDFSRVMDALMTRGFIVKYRIDGATDAWFGVIPSWKKHQIINNRERASQIPEPIALQHLIDACVTREARVDDADKGEGKGKEGKGKEGGLDDSSLNDEAWIMELSKEPAYQYIDVAREMSKMRAWCAANRKQPTRRRFVNWLNRVDKPLVQVTAKMFDDFKGTTIR